MFIFEQIPIVVQDFRGTRCIQATWRYGFDFVSQPYDLFNAITGLYRLMQLCGYKVSRDWVSEQVRGAMNAGMPMILCFHNEQSDLATNLVQDSADADCF